RLQGAEARARAANRGKNGQRPRGAGGKCGGVLSPQAAARRGIERSVGTGMKVTLLAFASAAQRLGWREREMTAQAGSTPLQLFESVAAGFNPGTARVAVNG